MIGRGTIAEGDVVDKVSSFQRVNCGLARTTQFTCGFVCSGGGRNLERDGAFLALFQWRPFAPINYPNRDLLATSSVQQLELSVDRQSANNVAGAEASAIEDTTG